MTALKKPKSRIGEVNVERILDAGLAVFARHGYSGARIDQIAETADMSKPNLLYYFRTKEELYRAVLTRTLDMWLKPLRELDPARSPREALGHYIDQKLAYSRGHPAASRLFAIEIMQGAPHLETKKNDDQKMDSGRAPGEYRSLSPSVRHLGRHTALCRFRRPDPNTHRQDAGGR
jgi:TetR/AcrR family transcriptional regulator